jgi:diguanylate cyclase (GGDEF)-like protein
MMVSMMLSLDKKTKSSRYLVFSLYIFLAALPYIGLIVLDYYQTNDIQISVFFKLLTADSYVLVQMVYFQLIKPKASKPLKIYVGTAAAFVLFSVLAFFFNHSLILMCSDLLQLAFTTFCYLYILPVLGNRRIYRFALWVYAAAAIANIINSIFNKSMMDFISVTLAMFFYFMMFRTVFERILDMMQAATYSSVTDALTGLFNRKYFDNKVSEYIEKGEDISVIFCDIDNFKKLNDTYGHQTGDEMLKFTAVVMKEVFEDIGICGRYGGEEMVALITDPSSDPGRIAEKFRCRIQDESQLLTPITVSVGFSRYNESVEYAQQLIKRADEAMYFSKQNGKNRVSNYDTTQKKSEEIHTS